MKRRALSAAIAVVTMTFASWANAIQLTPSVQRLERSFEDKLNEQLRRALGPQANVSVAIRFLTPALPAPSKKNGKKASEMSDLAYLPLPMDLRNPVGSSEEPSVTVEKPVDVSKAYVDLYIDRDLSKEVVESARTIVTASLRGYALEVATHRIQAAPPLSATQSAPAPITFPNFVTPALLLGAALVALGLLLWVAFHQLTAGLGDALQRLAPPPAAAMELEARLNRDEEEEGELSLPKSSIALPASVVESALARNLSIVEQTIASTPRFFVLAIDSQANHPSLRWLLPRLSEESRSVLGHLLPPGTATAMEQGDSVLPTEEQNFDWLSRVAEKITINKLQRGPEFDSTLGADRIGKLMRIPPDAFLRETQTVPPNEAPYLWRLVAGLLRPAELERVLERIGDAEWQALSEAHRVALPDLIAYTDHFLKRVESVLESPVDVARKEFASTYLFAPVVRLLSHFEPGADDQYLDSVAPYFPELREQVYGRVWTPRVLYRVPDVALASAFRAASNEQKAALVALLPRELGARLTAALPAGNAKTVILDEAKKLASNENRERSSRLVKDFLEKLRQQSLQGRFALSGPVEVQVVSSSEEAA